MRNSPLNDWPELVGRVRRATLLALFLDFDGTLSRIVERPEIARLDPGIAKALERLALQPKVRVAVISGRALFDLKKKVPLPNLYLAGCHGLEVEGRGMKFVHPEADRKWQEVRGMARALRTALAGIPGALVEEKELSVSAHYRLVPRFRVLDVREKIRRTVALQRGSWKIVRAKQVMEILPETGWTKGSCVNLLLSLYQAEVPPGASLLPLYIGDDLPDQDGFDAVRGRGVSIAVGESQELRADYRLKDVDEVRVFLKRVAESLEKGGGT